MHYKNGREAKNGDKVVLLNTYYGAPVVGILYDAVAGNDHCNGRLAAFSNNDPCPDLKNCLHADDAMALIADGERSREPADAPPEPNPAPKNYNLDAETGVLGVAAVAAGDAVS